MDFNYGTSLLDNDAYVFEMALYGVNNGKIDVYVKHLSNEELEAVIKPPRRSSIVIKALADEEIPVEKHVGNKK